jgi:anti-sigma B factor antagonist
MRASAAYNVALMPAEVLHVDLLDGPEEGTRVMVLNGPMTMDTRTPFQTAIRSEAAKRLVIDLNGVPYIDSAGLGALVVGHVSFMKSGREVVLTGINDAVASLFQITRVENLFAVYPSVEEALKPISAAN